MEDLLDASSTFMTLNIILGVVGGGALLGIYFWFKR